MTLNYLKTVYRRIYCRKVLTLSNQTLRNKSKSIRIVYVLPCNDVLRINSLFYAHFFFILISVHTLALTFSKLAGLIREKHIRNTSWNIHKKIQTVVQYQFIPPNLTLCPLGNFPCFFDICYFFQYQLFWKILSGILSECQTGSRSGPSKWQTWSWSDL